MKKQNQALLRFTVGRIGVVWGRRTSVDQERHKGKEMGGLKSDLTYTSFAQDGFAISSRTVCHVYSMGSWVEQLSHSGFCPSRAHGISWSLCSFLVILVGSCWQCPWCQFAEGIFTKAHRICPTRLRRLFFWMDLYLCMRKLGTGEAVAYFSFLFGFILCFRNRTD